MFKASNTLLGETNHQEVGFYDQQTGLWDKNTNITTPELMYSRSKISVRNMAGHLARRNDMKFLAVQTLDTIER